jgi:hypothetical protein
MTCINVIYRPISAGLGDALRLAETTGLSWMVDEKKSEHLAGEEHRLQDRPLRGGCHSPVDPDMGPTAGTPKKAMEPDRRRARHRLSVRFQDKARSRFICLPPRSNSSAPCPASRETRTS